QLQVYVKKDLVPDRDFQLYKLLDLGDFVGVEGTLFRTRTGELTVLANELTFLAKCFLPLPEKWHGLKDVEIRYRQRYVDLDVNRIFRNEGISTRHNPEFTMLEFYQAYSNYIDLMDLTEQMLAGIAEKVCGTSVITYDDHQIDFGKWTRLSMMDAILKYAPEK